MLRGVSLHILRTKTQLDRVLLFQNWDEMSDIHTSPEALLIALYEHL